MAEEFVTLTMGERPSGRVRWRRVNDRQGHVPGLVLELHYIVTEYRNGEPYGQSDDWREVEIV